MAQESIWSGFYKLSMPERQKRLAAAANLSEGDIALLNRQGPLALDVADKMSENVIGTVGLPLSIAPNFIVNKKEYVVPMAIEEPSVVAAASYAAKLAIPSGGFRAEYTGSIMIGQIQIVGIADAPKSMAAIESKKAELIAAANKNAEHITKYGGGVVDMQARAILTPRGHMLIVEYMANVQDAMGANAINTILEKMAPDVAKIAGGKPRLKILSNLATRRMASATATWKAADIGGDAAVEGILDAWQMAMSDPYRRATHNKGIMNGIDAVALACGNDWRAIEAGAHAYAAMKDAALTTYKKTAEGDIEGKIVLPLAVGTIGGSIRINPTAQLSLKILGAKTSGELAMVMASLGLAQNFAALRAMATEGIQKGHMRLHARNVASAAGASSFEIDSVVELMQKGGSISEQSAKDALSSLRKKK